MDKIADFMNERFTISIRRSLFVRRRHIIVVVCRKCTMRPECVSVELPKWEFKKGATYYVQKYLMWTDIFTPEELLELRKLL